MNKQINDKKKILVDELLVDANLQRFDFFKLNFHFPHRNGATK